MKDKIVLITGASSGIGLATAREFARTGARVVLAARRVNLLKDIENELKSQGYEAVSFYVDVTIESDCKKLIYNVIEKMAALIS